MEVVSVMYSVLENLKTALSTEPSGRAYNQYVDVIGVAGVLEPAEGADVVPAVDPGGEERIYIII